MGLEIRNKGFTLIELVVALAVFGLVVFAMTAIAGSVIQGQRKAFVLQDTQEAGRYILESISKEMRMSTINSGDSGGNSRTSLSITALKSTGNEDIDYQFNNDRVQRRVNGGGWQYISPDDLEVTGGFFIRKSTAIQPWSFVTIVMRLRSTGDKTQEQAEIYLQGSITARSF